MRLLLRQKKRGVRRTAALFADLGLHDALVNRGRMHGKPQARRTQQCTPGY
jgi:hypothetical protein